MPKVPFQVALSNAPRKLALGVGLFALLKISIFVLYGGSGGGGGPIALLFALVAFTTRRAIWAILLGITLLLNAFGLIFASRTLDLDLGAEFLVGTTAAIAVTAGWGSFSFARSLQKYRSTPPPTRSDA